MSIIPLSNKISILEILKNFKFLSEIHICVLNINIKKKNW